MKKIGWQKYEAMLEEQLHSPLLQTFYNNFLTIEEMEEEFDEAELEEMTSPTTEVVTMDQKMVENIALTSNFDCWMGHTNFNITNSTREELDRIDGIEI